MAGKLTDVYWYYKLSKFSWWYVIFVTGINVADDDDDDQQSAAAATSSGSSTAQAIATGKIIIHVFILSENFLSSSFIDICHSSKLKDFTMFKSHNAMIVIFFQGLLHKLLLLPWKKLTKPSLKPQVGAFWI